MVNISDIDGTLYSINFGTKSQSYLRIYWFINTDTYMYIKTHRACVCVCVQILKYIFAWIVIGTPICINICVRTSTALTTMPSDVHRHTHFVRLELTDGRLVKRRGSRWYRFVLVIVSPSAVHRTVSPVVRTTFPAGHPLYSLEKTTVPFFQSKEREKVKNSAMEARESWRKEEAGRKKKERADRS